MSEEQRSGEFTRLLDYLKASRGFDFGAYKISSLMRRIQKRMREVDVPSYAAYIDFLEVHPHEFGPLFDTVLINVTSFFRDTPAWQFLAEKVISRIVEEADPNRPIRIWSAGCATGEEAYSLAILLAEAMGEEEFRSRVKIYATDADMDALAAARLASYDARQVASIPPPWLEKYFEPAGSRFLFRSDLRRSLIFGRHDLIQDAAISRLELLVCRNVLMYFNIEVQEKILARFHFALNNDGCLFLGKAETLLTRSHNFRPLELRHRLFTRTPTAHLRDRLLALSPPSGLPEASGGSRHLRLRESAFENGPVAQITIDQRGHLVLANERARRLFGISVSDSGRLLQDLEISYRPVELRSRIDQAYADRALKVIPDVVWRSGVTERQLEVQVVPLIDLRGDILGASVSFIDLTQPHQLQVALQRANQDLETAYEELQSANEELETTNEELQSTVEELETTNEELQSANEELETMNEELQSTNEELRALNDQILQRSDELDQVNSYLESILGSLRSASIILDRSLHVTIWSQKAQDLWGVRDDEARGQALSEMDIGLPVNVLQEPLRGCLEGSGVAELVLDGINRRGKPLQCWVQCTPLFGSSGIEGVILMMDEVVPGAIASAR